MLYLFFILLTLSTNAWAETAATLPTSITWMPAAVPTTTTSKWVCATVNVTGATNANPIVISTAGHNFQTGAVVTIASVGGNTAANGSRTVTRINSTTFSIGVAGNGAYTSGGTIACDYSTLQSAISAASRDTTLYLNSGETYNAPAATSVFNSGFQLTAKSGLGSCPAKDSPTTAVPSSCWIVIRTHHASLPSLGTKFEPWRDSSYPAIIKKGTSNTTTVYAAISCADWVDDTNRVAFYWLDGIRFQAQSGALDATQRNNPWAFCTPETNQSGKFSDHLVYSHIWTDSPSDNTSTRYIKGGIYLTGYNQVVRDSYIYGLIPNGITDAFGIGGWEFIQYVLLENNTVSGWTENIFWGGSDTADSLYGAAYTNLAHPQDIEIKKNLIEKPIEWYQQRGCAPIAASYHQAASVATGATGVLTGTYRYKWTLWQSGTNYESDPTSASSAVTPSSQQVSLTAMLADAGSGTALPPLHPNYRKLVDKKRIYRTTNGGTTYYYLTSIAYDQSTYTDNTADASLNQAVTAPAAGNIVDERYCGVNVKNLFEVKHAVRFLLEGNVFQNLWNANQSGTAILFTPRQNDPNTSCSGGVSTPKYGEGCDPQTVVQDMTVRYNILKNVNNAFAVSGMDPGAAGTSPGFGCTPACFFRTQPGSRFTIQHNLVEGLGSGGSTSASGILLSLSNKSDSVTYKNNTLASRVPYATQVPYGTTVSKQGQGIAWRGVGTRNVVDPPGDVDSLVPGMMADLSIKNNIVEAGLEPVYGIDSTSGNGCDKASFINHVTSYAEATMWTNNLFYAFPNDAGAGANTASEQDASVGAGNCSYPTKMPGYSGGVTNGNKFAADQTAAKFTSPTKHDWTLQVTSPGHNAGSDSADMGVDIPTLFTKLGLTWSAP